MTSYPLVNRTLATFRKAEFGFLGVRVITCTQTPRLCGQSANAGDLDFTAIFFRPFRTSWLIVGIQKIRLNPWFGAKKSRKRGSKAFSRLTRGSVDYIIIPRRRKRFLAHFAPGDGVISPHHRLSGSAAALSSSKRVAFRRNRPSGSGSVKLDQIFLLLTSFLSCEGSD
jgi:hypothetical protein